MASAKTTKTNSVSGKTAKMEANSATTPKSANSSKIKTGAEPKKRQRAGSSAKQKDSESQSAMKDRERMQAQAAEPSADLALHEPAQEGDTSSIQEKANPARESKVKTRGRVRRPSAAAEGESAMSAKEAIKAAREAISSARAALSSAKDAILSAKRANGRSTEYASPDMRGRMMKEVSTALRSLATSMKTMALKSLHSHSM